MRKYNKDFYRCIGLICLIYFLLILIPVVIIGFPFFIKHIFFSELPDPLKLGIIMVVTMMITHAIIRLFKQEPSILLKVIKITFEFIGERSTFLKGASTEATCSYCFKYHQESKIYEKRYAPKYTKHLFKKGRWYHGKIHRLCKPCIFKKIKNKKKLFAEEL